MEDQVRHIAIITYQFSVVVKSIENGLRDQGFEVSLLPEDISAITSVTEYTDVFLVYLPETLFDDTNKIKNLFLICDTVKDKERSLIVIGSGKDHDTFMKVVPSLKSFTWLDRPVEMRLLLREIEKETKKVEQFRAKKKILFIDDDPVYSRMVCEWLKDKYHMDYVEDGMKGIAYLTNNKVDLILLDYEMPVVDGAKILEMLRMHPDTGSIPVIFLTGVRTKGSIERVMGLKPQGYMLKSSKREEIIRKLDAFFEKHDTKKG